MNHLILLGLCLLSVEIINRSNYFKLISSLIELTKKAIYIISNKNISDHWKENVITKYSMKMIQLSLQMTLIFFFISFIFMIVDKYFNGFLEFTFSWSGIIESIIFAFVYVYFRKLIIK